MAFQLMVSLKVQKLASHGGFSNSFFYWLQDFVGRVGF